MLELRNIAVSYGKIQAIKDISLNCEKGDVVTLIGANGAGKSTCLKAISGLVPITSGEIWFDGKRIDRMAPHRIAQLGIAHIPEGKRLFLRLSVFQNIMSGSYTRTNKNEIGRNLEKTYEYFPILKERLRQKAGTLSGGEQQMLAFGRGLLANPKIFLFDEPSLGIAPILVSEIAEHIRVLSENGATILLIEQNARLALQLANKAYLLENGQIIMEGTPREFLANSHIQHAYIGLE